MEASSMCEEINTNVVKVMKLADKMLTHISTNVSTANGLSFLEMRYHMLLSYLTNLTYVMLRKSTGAKIEDDTSIHRLVEIRTVLEKIKPIEYKLKYQIDKLVKSAVSGNVDESDPSHYKANPDGFMAKIVDSSDEDSASGDEIKHKDKKKHSGVYVPPKLAAVHYDGDETTQEKLRKVDEKTRRRAVSGAILRELKEEYLDAPVEDSYGGEKKLTMNYENKRKIKYEEDYMTRLPVTKQEKHQKRQYSTLNTLGDELTTFGGSLKVGGLKSKKNSKAKKHSKKRRYI